MNAIKLIVASALIAAFGTAVACPDKPTNQSQSGTVSKPSA